METGKISNKRFRTMLKVTRKAAKKAGITPADLNKAISKVRKEPEIRPEYLRKLKRLEKGKFIKFKSVDELRKLTSK